MTLKRRQGFCNKKSPEVGETLGAVRHKPENLGQEKDIKVADKVKGILLREETLEAMLALSDEQRGRLILALFADSGMCEEPELDPMTRMAFLCIVPGVRRAQEEASRRYAASVENGKKGGRPRKQPVQDVIKETDGITEKPTGFEETDGLEKNQNQIKPNQVKLNINTPLTPQGELVQDKPARMKAEYPADFEEFWKLYPRKNGKDAALSAWKTKKREGRLPALSVLADAIAAAKRTDQWQRDGGQYIPHPATWLNQGRWMDESAEDAAERERMEEMRRRAQERRAREEAEEKKWEAMGAF